MLGLMCALFAVITSNIVFILWDSATGLPDAGSMGGVIFDLQRLAVFLVFAALAGVLSIMNLNKSRNDVIVSGAIAGASMAILLFLPLILLMQNPAQFHNMLYMSLPPYLLSSGVADYTDSFMLNLDMIIAQAWLAMIFIFLAITAVAAGAAYYSANDKQGKLRKDIGKPAMVIGVLVLAAVIIPAVIGTAGVGAGVVPHPTSINYVAVTTVDESGGNSTFNIEIVGSPGSRYLDKGRPFIIFVDGKEATNQSIAAANGLQVTLEPQEGLAYEKGSKLKIKGISSSSKIEILAHFSDGISKTILNY